MAAPATIAALAALVTAGRPAVETACRSFEALTGKTLEVAGAMLADGLYKRRVRNLLDFLEMITPRMQALQERGIDLKPLAEDFGLRLFEAVQTVSDPNLRVLWAGLLESGVRHEGAQRPVYIQILHSIGPSEAHTLREIAETLSAGLDRGRLATLMPDVGILHALGVVEVSEMPFWHDGSLSSHEHARQVRASASPVLEPPSAKVTLSLLGSGLIDAVDVHEPGQGWGERAVKRTRDLVKVVDNCIPTSAPGLGDDDLIREVLAASSIPTSRREVIELLHGYSDSMGWINRPGPGWRRKVPGTE